jgi:hypothetical protein
MALKLCAMALLIWLVAGVADARSVGWFPRKIGDCGWVHGRYVEANGSRVHRIWVIRTKHVLSLDTADEAAPAMLADAWDTVRGNDRLSAVYGDFLVCAVEHFRPEHMQAVHLKKAAHLKER